MPFATTQLLAFCCALSQTRKKKWNKSNGKEITRTNSTPIQDRDKINQREHKTTIAASVINFYMNIYQNSVCFFVFSGLTQVAFFFVCFWFVLTCAQNGQKDLPNTSLLFVLSFLSLTLWKSHPKNLIKGKKKGLDWIVRKIICVGRARTTIWKRNI